MDSIRRHRPCPVGRKDRRTEVDDDQRIPSQQGWQAMSREMAQPSEPQD